MGNQSDPDVGHYTNQGGLGSSKMSIHERQNTGWNFLNKRKLKRHKNKIKCKILDCIIKEKVQGLFWCVWQLKTFKCRLYFDNIIASMSMKFLGCDNGIVVIEHLCSQNICADIFRDEMMFVIEFQMEKERNYQENVANYELTFKYRVKKREQEKEKQVYEATVEKLMKS